MTRHFIGALIVAAFLSADSLAHPGAGIVVDRDGNVYFTHTGRGLAKLDGRGKLTYINRSNGGHWLCLDPQGAFFTTQPKYFERISLSNSKASLIFADGGSPIAMLPDGNLYFASNDEKLTPGALQVTRQTPSGQVSVFPAAGRKHTEKLGITGLASGAKGALYVALPSSILKLDTNGTFHVIAESVELKDCDVDYPDHNSKMPMPSFRGIAVDENEVIYAAAVGCHLVVTFTPNKKVQTVAKSERPWSPTGVATHGGDVYILEFSNANGSANEGWRPRIRKVDATGKISVLLTVEE